jgi:hypothetical protein
MTWKSVSAVIVMLAFCTSLMPQDKQAQDKQTQDKQIAPVLGVWELDVKKTVNYGDMVNQTFVNTPAPGGGFISTRAMIHTENKSNTEIHPYAFDGKPHRSSGSDIRDFYYKLIDPLTIERTYERNGEKIVDHEQVSKDGKTMTVTQPGGRVRIYRKTFEIKPLEK